MVSYRITRLARDDLESIWNYTAGQWSPEQAETYIDGLLACFDAIAAGTLHVTSVDHIRKDYKKAVYGQHLVFFTTGPDRIAEIVRVLHGSMDVGNRL